jgi:hypothetical protein
MKRLLFLFVITQVCAQSSVGFIDRDSAVKFIPEYQKSEDLITKRVKEVTDTFEIYMKAWQDWNHSHRSIPTDIQKDTLRYRLYMEQLNAENKSIMQDMERYQEYASKTIINIRDSLQKQVSDLLNAKASEFCTLNKISLLVDEKSILHCTQCKNYMREFILFLQNQK